MNRHVSDGVDTVSDVTFPPHPRYERRVSWSVPGIEQSVLATLVVIALRRWSAHAHSVDQDGALLKMGSRGIFFVWSVLTPTRFLPLALRLHVAQENETVRVEAHMASDFIEDFRPTPAKKYSRLFDSLSADLQARPT